MASFDRHFYRILLLIILLTAAGQMTNTIYVPALTQMAHEFSVSVGRMQAVIACYLFPYGLLQFFYGPYSDRFGRKPMILIGIVFFTLGSILAVFATHFITLLIASFLQGSGIAVAGVMARTVMRDLYSGMKLHSANSIMAIALIFAPLIAPLLGGLFTDLHSWRAIFVFLTIYGILLLVIQWLFFPETNTQKSTKGNLLAKYKTVLSNGNFMINLILLIVANGGVAVFEVSSGALFTSVLQLSPAVASLFFIIPLPCYMFGSFLSARLARRYSLDRLLLIGCFTLLISGIALGLSYYVFGVTSLSIILPGCLYFLGCGIIFPTATTKALEEFPSIAGTAGAVLGGAQNLGAGLLTALAAFIPLKNQLPLAIILSTLSVCALVSVMMSQRSRIVKVS
ncbi:Bcr/CflA family efflux MFS transporter [Cysteiniphilum sp. JM-1]|uniref:Bcr/CflA family efflux MFS transporter n=1 Tax=Cysteiniphilum sp. JM-1 TaxID=2610891 RepID=UPI001244B7EF|nr:Bcr/CflA family efflux MFS transporter [Cysteiniphilum sp. JM-1]